MKGVLVAAGLGSRMGAFTEAKPKCLLPVAGGTVYEHTLSLLRSAGCQEIIVVTGHLAEQLHRPDVALRHNPGYRDNNILHSLMHARDAFDGPLIVSYSDIWVEPHIYQSLLRQKGDIVIAVDNDWLPYYEGRSQHPVAEAENALVDDAGRVIATGKHLDPAAARGGFCGEFLGLMKLSADGARRFADVFDDLDRQLSPLEPFQQAAEWRKAYITDMLQELVDRGETVDAAVIKRGWAELDTAEDYERLERIAARQGLSTIAGFNGNRAHD